MRRYKQTCLKCCKCGKGMSSLRDLTSHNCAISKTTAKFKCDLSGKQFGRKNNCLRHKRTSFANGRKSNGENLTVNTMCLGLRGSVFICSDSRLNNESSTRDTSNGDRAVGTQFPGLRGVVSSDCRLNDNNAEFEAPK